MKKLLFITICLLIALPFFGKEYSIKSPDKTLELIINVGENLTYKVLKDGEILIEPSAIGLISNQCNLNDFTKVLNTQDSTMRINYDLLWGTTSTIQATGNLLTLNFSEKIALQFCAFNDGIAWRYKTTYNNNLQINNEVAEFNLNTNSTVYFPEVKGFSNPFEANFLPQKVSQVSEKRLGLTPLLVKTQRGKTMVISEANLFEYPGMFMNLSNNGLTATFPNYPAKEKEQFLGRMRLVNIPQFSKLLVTDTKEYIAKTKGTRTFPWRTIQIENEDKDLLSNNLIALLAKKPAKTEDYSWVKPGKVVWDWYHKWNLQDVDFKPGINTATYKYMIDFAVKNKIEYVNIDDGWCGLHNFKKVNKNLDLQAVLSYAKEKEIGIFLWCTWQTLDENLIENLDYFQSLGIAGLKVDFFDRCDQRVVDFVNTLAKEAAQRKLLLNLHGMYKPTGLQISYPNVVNCEGVLGLEYNKFSDKCTPTHNLTIPFVRNVVGPMDYTPGSMRYVSPTNFEKSWTNPHTMSTRAQQLAMYVIYHGGIQMLADSPTLFEQDSIAMEFLSKVPVTWDETVPLYGNLGKAIAIARRSGTDWYIAAMTANEPKDFEIDLSFLKGDNYKMKLIENGTLPEQLNVKKTTINNNNKLKISVKELGGFIALLQLVK